MIDKNNGPGRPDLVGYCMFYRYPVLPWATDITNLGSLSKH